MRARSTMLVLLALTLATTGCIKIDEWQKYNKAPGERCTSADECLACAEGITWDCTGPPGDQGICPLRTREVPTDGGTVTMDIAICRMSNGEIGMNCSGESPGACDFSYCVYATAAERGVCSRTCDDGSCPSGRFACTQTPRTGGGTMNWCAQLCTTDLDCDSNATCETVSTGSMVCFPS
jgi:hypothetical protein